MRHLYLLNLKIWLRDATRKVIPNTHMELDMFPIPQISSYCGEINHTENHSDSTSSKK